MVAWPLPFLKAAGFNIGSSICEKDKISFCQHLLDQYQDKLILPIDIITATEIKENVQFMKDLSMKLPKMKLA